MPNSKRGMFFTCDWFPEGFTYVEDQRLPNWFEYVQGACTHNYANINSNPYFHINNNWLNIIIIYYPVLPFRMSVIVPLIHVQTLPILSCFVLLTFLIPRDIFSVKMSEFSEFSHVFLWRPLFLFLVILACHTFFTGLLLFILITWPNLLSFVHAFS